MDEQRRAEDRLMDGAMNVLGRRTGRRSFLLRAAGVGAAVAASPVGVLLDKARADHTSCTRCSDCSSSSGCCGGYTVFCCTLNGSNSCPADTFMGGWWRCDYNGSSFCQGSGKRFYIDCHADPNTNCSHCNGDNCHCGNNNCSDRRSCCTKFRYGQCNRNIDPPGAGDPNYEYISDRPIKCRMVKCSNPGSLYPERCDSTPVFEDPTTCSHEPGCLS